MLTWEGGGLTIAHVTGSSGQYSRSGLQLMDTGTRPVSVVADRHDIDAAVVHILWLFAWHEF